MKSVQILGTGCPRCAKLAANVAQAINELGIECEVEKVTDINAIMKFGVIMTPALVVDGEVKVAGKVPTAEEITGLLS